MKETIGSKLVPHIQQTCLARFVHRFTREHKPEWARGEWKDGKPYPLQFDSDKDWLAHTVFMTTKTGRLDERYNYCRSYPTWPDNPELAANRSIRVKL